MLPNFSSSVPLVESHDFPSFTQTISNETSCLLSAGASHCDENGMSMQLGESSSINASVTSAHSTAKLSRCSVSCLQMSSHAFPSSNLPNLSLAHVAHSVTNVHPAPTTAAGRGLNRQHRTAEQRPPVVFIEPPVGQPNATMGELSDDESRSPTITVERPLEQRPAYPVDCESPERQHQSQSDACYPREGDAFAMRAATKQTKGQPRPASAKERSLSLHRQRIEQLNEQREASLARQRQAKERRQFLTDHHQLRQAASWSVMVLLAQSADPLVRLARDLTARRRRRQKMGGRLIYPVVMLGLRRALRRARQRLLTARGGCEPPSTATLRSDKILCLFPDAILSSAARSMTIRYFFPNEAIIFMGCEEDEAYVLSSGTADVMMGAAKVFTMQPGMVLGTLGMISGEPRSASIIARGDGCLAWVMKRAVFDAAGDSATMNAAHEALAEVRQKNMMNVYRSRLDPVALSAFPLFHGLEPDFLSGLLAGSEPRVVRRGTVLADPNSVISSIAHLFLLKGTVSIRYQEPVNVRGPCSSCEERFSLPGELRNMVDIPSCNKNSISSAGGKHPALQLAALLDPSASVKRGVRRASVSGLVCSHSTRAPQQLDSVHFLVSAPALLNVNTLFLPGGMMRTAPFNITAATDCDLLSLSRKTLRSQDVLELASMQQNALNVHGDFLGTPSKRDVAHMLLDNVAPLFALIPSAQAVLTTLRSAISDPVLGAFRIEKWVYPARGYLCFERSNEFLINIIIDGALEDEGVRPPVKAFSVWPPLSEAWFAAHDAAVRTTKRTVALRVHRSDVLTWFCRALPDPQDLRVVCTLFANNVTLGGALASVMGFSTFGLDSEIGSAADGAASRELQESSLRKSTRSYSVVSDADATTANVLQAVLQSVTMQLKRLDVGASNTTKHAGQVRANSTDAKMMRSPTRAIPSSSAAPPTEPSRSMSSPRISSAASVPSFGEKPQALLTRPQSARADRQETPGTSMTSSFRNTRTITSASMSPCKGAHHRPLLQTAESAPSPRPTSLLASEREGPRAPRQISVKEAATCVASPTAPLTLSFTSASPRAPRFSTSTAPDSGAQTTRTTVKAQPRSLVEKLSEPSTTAVRKVERHLPVQLHVNLDALRGKRRPQSPKARQK